MNSTQISSTPPSETPKPSRRTVMKGAAWGLPVLASALAAPIASASCIAGQHPLLKPSASTHSAAEQIFQVPAGVRRIKVTVIGGWGAGFLSVASGGSGDLVTAYIDVTPGEQLTLIAGNGGASAIRTGSDRFQTILGGGGFGSGGDASPRNFNYGIDSSTYSTLAASGGGGSAILRSGAPLVVAGGGGATGAPRVSEWHMYDWSAWSTSGGDGGGQRGANASVSRFAPSIAIAAYGGEAGTVTAPGAGGAGGTLSGATRTDGRAGVTGGSYGAAGGDGANAATSNIPAISHWDWVTPHYTVSEGNAIGAGGGGYTGGGSGSAIAGTGSNDLYYCSATGGGGGGASYWAEGVVVEEHRPAGAKNTSSTRKPGSIAISWAC